MNSKAGNTLIVVGVIVILAGAIPGIGLLLLQGFPLWLRIVGSLVLTIPALAIGLTLSLVGALRSWRAYRALWRQRAAEYASLGAEARLPGAITLLADAERELYHGLVAMLPNYLFKQDEGAVQLVATIATGGRSAHIFEFSDHTRDGGDIRLHWQLIALPTEDSALRGWCAIGVLPGWVDQRLRPRDRADLRPLDEKISGIGAQGLFVIRDGLAAWLPAQVLSPTEAVASGAKLAYVVEEVAAQRATT